MRKTIAYIIILVITLIPALVLAQGPGGGDLPGDPGTPIDGGASLLAGAAAFYGIRKLKGKNAKQT